MVVIFGSVLPAKSYWIYDVGGVFVGSWWLDV
jgi:hypothetical protein